MSSSVLVQLGSLGGFSTTARELLTRLRKAAEMVLYMEYDMRTCEPREWGRITESGDGPCLKPLLKQ